MQKTIDVHISNFESGWANGKEVTFFLLECSIDNVAWVIRKRYNDFHVLNERLHDSHSALPLIPNKSFFTLKKPQDLEKRRQGLENYITGLARRLEFYSNPVFTEFIELKNNMPCRILNEPVLKKQLSHVLMGYRDIYFSPNKKYYFTACYDHNSMSRIDSYFTNFSFPWDKPKTDDTIKIAVGVLECWARKEPDPSSPYEKLWVRHFKSQCICLAFSEELRLVAVGCDNGQLTLIKLDDQDHTKYSLYSSQNIHAARIMKIVIDEQNNALYTIGEDRYLKVFSLQSLEIVHQLMVAQNKPTNMEVDLENQVAYIVDRNGCLGVVSLYSNPPMFKQSVKICHGASGIRGFDIDFPSGQIFAASTDSGILHVLRLSDRSDPEASIKKERELTGSAFIRVLKYCPQTRNLVLGHFNGVLSVINEEVWEHGPVFSCKVHYGNINQIQLMENGKSLITASSDKTIKVTFADLSFGSFL